MEYFLGIDTSCYTTSLAVIDSEGNLLSEARRLLEVAPGGRGLAQNEAVFRHVANLPELFAQIATPKVLRGLRGIAASTRPRPVEGSYMPVFRVAESYGRSIAALTSVAFAETSHQEGHLAAGIWSAGGPRSRDFLAVHLSGGTTELLRVTRNSADGGFANDGGSAGRDMFAVRVLGGTTDLHAGQFVDRVGVAMGLPFPAGPKLELLAGQASPESGSPIPSSVKGYDISFSGPEAAALRMVEQGLPGADIARAVERCIAVSLEKVIRRAVADTGLKEVLIVGGVAANRYIRERLTEKLGHRAVAAKLYFAEPRFSSDNAVGVALIGMKKITGNFAGE